MERILALIPARRRARWAWWARRSATIRKIVEIIETLADRGSEVGLSSLRPDRLNDAFVAALRRARPHAR